jgi:hypothetical protein
MWVAASVALFTKVCEALNGIAWQTFAIRQTGAQR